MALPHANHLLDKFLFFLLLGLICLFPKGNAYSQTSSPESADIAVDVAYENKENTLNFKITNKSSDDVEIYTHKLPWGYQSSVFFMLIPFGDKCTQLEEFAELESVPLVPQIVIIKPGVSISGKVKLNRIWKGLSSRSIACQDMLFWSYELLSRTQKSYGRFGGAISIYKSLK